LRPALPSIVPRTERHGLVVFRDVVGQHRRANCAAEMAALS
jgi:hypothetical protein